MELRIVCVRLKESAKRTPMRPYIYHNVFLLTYNIDVVKMC